MDNINTNVVKTEGSCMVKYLGYLVEAALFGILLVFLNYINIPVKSKEGILILALVWAVAHVVILNLFKKKSENLSAKKTK